LNCLKAVKNGSTREGWVVGAWVVPTLMLRAKLMPLVKQWCRRRGDLPASHQVLS